MAGPQRIGVLGGTFDPPHVGHLAAAVHARHALGLERVLLVVANEPWQKTGSRSVTPAEDRYAMVAAAAEGLEGVEASRVELDRGGPSYMADTAAELQRRWPGAELLLVVGADLLPELETWERHHEVRDRVALAVVTRPGSAGVALPAGWRGELVDMPALEVSSTELRAWAAAGRPLDVLVPAGALREIRRRGLYPG